MNIPGSLFSVVNIKKRVKNKNERTNPIPVIDNALSWVCVTGSDACLKACLEHLINFQTVITPKTMKRIMCGAHIAILYSRVYTPRALGNYPGENKHHSCHSQTQTDFVVGCTFAMLIP